MKTLQLKKIIISLVISLMIISISGYQNTQGSSKEIKENENIYLPLIIKPRPITIFGTQIHYPSNTTIMQKAEDSGAYWIRYQAFDWSKIEPIQTNPPTYNWSVVNETGLQDITNRNLKTIAIIHNTPSWAQKISGKTCGPIAAEDFTAFSQFIKALVTRYSSSSYNVKYWEFINEPDAAWQVLPGDSVFGCWGDESDNEYYGGDYYAEMLKVGYEAVKSVDPDGKVVLGGLLLDCDPTHVSTCIAGKFFDGILSHGGGNYFDIANYHGYAPQIGDKIYDEDLPKWSHRGGSVKGKADLLKTVMQNYGISKPIILSEAALQCAPGNTCNNDLPAFFENQADYVLRVFSSSQTIGLLGTIWYQFEGPGWCYTGLLNGDGSTKPAYNAFQFMTQQMQGTTVLGESTAYSGVTTYRFSASDKQIWVMWSTDQSNKAVNLPSNTIRVLDKYGTVIYSSPIPSTITINRPVYVELPK
jgi:hypothetical protein